MLKQNCKIILASTSKVRKKILEDAGFDFRVLAPDFDEEEAKKNLPSSITCKDTAMILAEGKALSISKKYKDVYVIGSDQVCEFNKKNFSKSNNAKEAATQLLKFNGKTHYQNNGLVVALNGKIIFRNFSAVKMQMQKLSKKEIESYVKKDQPWGCAGSYKYESFGKYLFKKTEGDYHAILGLAVQPLIAFFHKKKLIFI